MLMFQLASRRDSLEFLAVGNFKQLPHSLLRFSSRHVLADVCHVMRLTQLKELAVPGAAYDALAQHPRHPVPAHTKSVPAPPDTRRQTPSRRGAV